ncbi:MAG: LamG domain-containing protein [Nanoarchaeota archaeon]
MALSSRLAVFLVVTLVLVGLILIYSALTLLSPATPAVNKSVSEETYASYRAQAPLDFYDADNDPYPSSIFPKRGGSDDNSDDDFLLGLVAYFPFDEASGSNIFEDEENGYEARCSSSTCPESGVEGVSNNAIRFDGVDDIVLLENNNALRFSDSFSVSFWFKGSSPSRRQFLVGTWDGTPNTLGWQAGVVRGGICEGMDFYVSEDGTSGNNQHRAYRRTCDNYYMDNRWHHYVGVFEPNNRLELYIDGDLVGTTVGNVSALDGVFAGVSPIRIGSGFGDDGEEAHFTGLFDELYLFDRALSNEDIRALLER